MVQFERSNAGSYTVGSLFAGIGGFCRAFKNVGFEVVWANEFDSFAAETYRNNFPEVRLCEKSISDLSVVGDKLEPVDVLTAGFPCQPFSVAGSKEGFKDPRGKVFLDIIRLLKEFGSERPKILLMENVKNLLHHNVGKSFSRVVNEVQSAGYWFNDKNAAILNTCVHTNIPQNRERLYMAAFSWDAFDFNDFSFPEEVEEKRTVESFLDIEQKAEDEYYFDPGQKYGKLFQEKMSVGDDRSIYQLRRYYVRELRDYLVPTLTANMGGGGHNKPVIKDDWGIRNLTPLECLRLQGFDESVFQFPDQLSLSQQYKQIGNSVTISLVEKLALECVSKLDLLEGGEK